MNPDVAPYEAALAAADLPQWLRWSVEIRPRRKAVAATVEPGGGVVVCVPPGADPAAVVVFVKSNRLRLARAVAESEAVAPEYSVKEFVNGEGFRLFGANHRLHVTDDADAAPIVAGPGPSTWSGVRTYQLTLRRDAATPDTVVGWYQREGDAYVGRRAPETAGRLGVAAADMPTIRVRDLYAGRPATWATYLPRTHSIRIHWALFQLPRDVVDLVLTHELAHAALRGQSSHGLPWQRLMDRTMWDWRTREVALNDCGRRVWVGDVA